VTDWTVARNALSKSVTLLKRLINREIRSVGQRLNTVAGMEYFRLYSSMQCVCVYLSGGDR
jgi:hypothetical protein